MKMLSKTAMIKCVLRQINAHKNNISMTEQYRHKSDEGKFGKFEQEMLIHKSRLSEAECILELITQEVES